MTDNKSKDEKQETENPQQEPSSGPIIPAGNKDLITPKQETPNMEVHHHAHHEGKKNWKSYLWEFLMLFLAVFCGFLAEYQLEHMIEKSREKQFIESFIEDLKSDTASIRRGLLYQNGRTNQLDSLTLLLSEEKIKGYENDLYYWGRLLTRTSRFQTNDRTITQLKYSGALRLIRNESAADSIISYQKLAELILQNQEDERLERRALDPLLARMYNPFVFDKMLGESNQIKKPDGYPPLRSYDRDLQMDLAYGINQLKGSNLILKARLEQLDAKAKNAISFLQQQYKID